MNVRATIPEVDAGALLPGAQFIDAYSVAVDGAALDARHAAEKMLLEGPRWIDALTSLRNHLVKPFGLKTPSHVRPLSTDTVGIFPVISEAPDRLVAGFDDSHLDFRVVVDVATAGNSQRVTVTTVVLTHNLLGRTYLAIILPFHRLIARAMLRQVAA
ncbi:MAG TPA: DUF2867 domain-containing protein [Bradyrhizobium sp.]|jgi:hypothetical protein|nr:DUF2867 domain-containing protein [Bradyrhizobium sp.]